MGLMLMLLTVAGVFAAGVLLLVGIYTGKAWLRNFVAGGVAVWFTFYLAMLLGVSLQSERKELGRSEPKKYCGFYLDCHMHTAVAGVQRSKTIGNKTAEGEFYIVTVGVFSDAVRATLGLTTVEAHVVDATGRTYTRDMAAEDVLKPQPDFEKRIGPEESFQKQIVFDLPVDIVSPRLDIREGMLPERLVEAFLIGDEDSFFHKRTLFKLDEPEQTAGL